MYMYVVIANFTCTCASRSIINTCTHIQTIAVYMYMYLWNSLTLFPKPVILHYSNMVKIHHCFLQYHLWHEDTWCNYPHYLQESIGNHLQHHAKRNEIVGMNNKYSMPSLVIINTCTCICTCTRMYMYTRNYTFPV